MSLRDEIAKLMFETILGRSHDAPSMHRQEFEELADAILALPEMKEMQEQNEVLVSFFRALSTLTGDRGNVDKCTKTIREWKEKAEKWDRVTDSDRYKVT